MRSYPRLPVHPYSGSSLSTIFLCSFNFLNRSSSPSNHLSHPSRRARKKPKYPEFIWENAQIYIERFVPDEYLP